MRALEIITTSDGSQSLRMKGSDVTFHSRHGAIAESRHIFIKHGFEHAIGIHKHSLRILEVGFGTGLNAVLTGLEAAKQNITVFYHALEKYPLPESIYTRLNYAAQLGEAGQSLLNQLHTSPWNTELKVNEHFIFRKTIQDLLHFKGNHEFDLVYFDAFAPAANPELWTAEVFKLMAGGLAKGGCLVTFCAKGEVKRQLKKCGYLVETLNGPPGKREMTRATIPSH